jgi:hypothetical protein
MAHKHQSGRRPATKLPNLQKKLQQQRRELTRRISRRK